LEEREENVEETLKSLKFCTIDWATDTSGSRSIGQKQRLSFDEFTWYFDTKIGNVDWLTKLGSVATIRVVRKSPREIGGWNTRLKN
jgi:hypothetical protein